MDSANITIDSIFSHIACHVDRIFSRESSGA